MPKGTRKADGEKGRDYIGKYDGDDKTSTTRYTTYADEGPRKKLVKEGSKPEPIASNDPLSVPDYKSKKPTKVKAGASNPPHNFKKY